ncbi:PF07786 family protein [Bacteriovorax sp. BAL6_X]|uniref:DUF1624 domain-containing protein n=1 Tax=Bacteriovorax sp. BAL6_X TaxID=1201290 RepID=UPI0003860562|nr:DUF1624 domain-containing protein [Bacteriovorax sp. BAL6_X]EPZ51913.1 PF07786 family protein [Bacteriovorax sp. BAL6_X]
MKTKRIYSIDALRGIVMMIMLFDHVRERFFMHEQVLDPMDLSETSTLLFLTRFMAHFCAPVFVCLTGLSAWLYGQKEGNTKRDVSEFLLKRGLFLIFLELTLINFSWVGSFETIWLQVIWAIGLSMILLSGLIHLPKKALLVLAPIIIFGHNLLDPIHFDKGEFGYTLWSILHDRGLILETDILNIKASYPILPWIGVITLGYCLGPIFAKEFSPQRRWKLLTYLGSSAWMIFICLRLLNIYGEKPWVTHSSYLKTFLSFINVTKYPPSLAFLLITLGTMFFALKALEKLGENKAKVLSVFGAAPMFFYIVHLYVLLLSYTVASLFMEPNHGDYIGFNSVSFVWLVGVLLNIALYFPTRAFAKYKQKSNSKILKYF